MSLKVQKSLLFIFWDERKTHLFGKQTVHDEEHHPLKAAEDGEQVRHDYGAPLELETSKDPHGAQHAQLSHCSNSECPAGGSKDTCKGNPVVKSEALISKSLLFIETDKCTYDQTLSYFIFCKLSRSGFKLENFCANFQTVMRKKKMLTWKETEVRF